MACRYHYTGCFLQPAALYEAVRPFRTQSLARPIAAPHVTFVYKPAQVDETLFGQRVRVCLTGYANDGRNEGVRVTLETACLPLQRLIGQIAVPHITLSVGSTGRPADTGALPFAPAGPVWLEGVYGGYIEGRGPVTQPPR